MDGPLPSLSWFLRRLSLTPRKRGFICVRLALPRQSGKTTLARLLKVFRSLRPLFEDRGWRARTRVYAEGKTIRIVGALSNRLGGATGPDRDTTEARLPSSILALDGSRDTAPSDPAPRMTIEIEAPTLLASRQSFLPSVSCGGSLDHTASPTGSEVFSVGQVA
ncbi:hypothetical protein KM043_009623 [Ampulex compressa]|nr:hypothetical protein KM043_009623 [Ampulex compressa]